MKRATVLITGWLLAASVVACGKDPVANDDPVEPEAAPQLTLSPDSVVVAVGDGSLVNATIRNASGPTQYVSRDVSVATVNANGAIRAVGIGSTYVVGTLSDRPAARDSVRVRVFPLPTNGEACPASRPSFGAATNADRALFAYDVNAPLNLQKTAQTTTAVFALNRISYNSPDGGSVTGIMAEPVGRPGLRPGIVIMHPSGTPAQGMAPYAQQLAALGAVVIAIDAPYFRRNGTSQLLFTSQDRQEQVQLIKDLQRAVDVLIATEKVDAARIAFEGYSYGGIMGAGFVGIERRLKAAVLTAADGGWITHQTTPANSPSLANLSCATRALWFQTMTAIEPIRFIPNAAPTTLLFQAGRFDTTVLPSDAQALYDAASSPKELRWYDAGHALNQQAVIDKVDWLREKIGLD